MAKSGKLAKKQARIVWRGGGATTGRKGHENAQGQSKTRYALACPKCGNDRFTSIGGEAKCDGPRCNIKFNGKGIIT